MAAGATQSWQSDEAVNDLASQLCRLLVKFTLGALDNVDAAFTYPTAADDLFSFVVPPRRASHPVRHVFRNGLELSGDFQLVRYNDDVEIGVWGHLCVPWDADSSTLFEPEVPCSNAFSYLFLNNAAIDPNTCSGSFVEYTPPSPPEDTLYDHLANLAPPTWYAVQATTQFYLDGTFPTAYPFVSNIAMLNGPISTSPHVNPGDQGLANVLCLRINLPLHLRPIRWPLATSVAPPRPGPKTPMSTSSSGPSR
jgi:hypothetical protein